jgi:hypothetical protein
VAVTWMSRDDDRVQLPVVLGPVSNGEFLPAAASRSDVRLAEAVLQRAAAAADRLGIDRRRFLQTAGGMAALLGTLNLAACRPVSSRSHMAADVAFPNPADVSERYEPHGNGTTERTTCLHVSRCWTVRICRRARVLPPAPCSAPNADLVRRGHRTARVADHMQIRRFT